MTLPQPGLSQKQSARICVMPPIRQGLQPALGMDRIHNHTARNPRAQPGRHIQCSKFPAQKSPQQHYGDFIDQRRRNQEGKRHTQRNSGRRKAQKKRNTRAGAEGRDRPEYGTQNIAYSPTLSRQNIPDFLGPQSCP